MGLEEKVAEFAKYIDFLVSIRARGNDPIETFATILYELGEACKSQLHWERYSKSSSECKAYLAELKVSLADTFAQLLILCRQLGFSYDEVLGLGFERIKERAEERMKDRDG